MSKQERVYAHIREHILSGAYGPGYRLVIDALAAELQVSALPVREAVRRLEAEGLVVYRPNVGAHVTPADPRAFEDHLAVLAVLEGYATALAAPRIDAGDLAALEAKNDEMRACMERLDVLGFGRANQEFHLAIYDCCPNPYLVELLRNTGRRLDAIRRTVFTHIPYRGLESIEEHRALIDLIREGAPAEAVESAARQHKLRTIDAFHRWQREHEERVPAHAAGGS